MVGCIGACRNMIINARCCLPLSPAGMSCRSCQKSRAAALLHKLKQLASASLSSTSRLPPLQLAKSPPNTRHTPRRQRGLADTLHKPRCRRPSARFAASVADGGRHSVSAELAAHSGVTLQASAPMGTHVLSRGMGSPMRPSSSCALRRS